MGHCINDRGAGAFGQLGVASNVVNDSAHNVLLALTEWVEEGNAPDVIVGTTLPVEGNTTQEQRVHCRYPQRSMFNGSEFVCKS
jgi:feruloyl esterase